MQGLLTRLVRLLHWHRRAIAAACAALAVVALAGAWSEPQGEQVTVVVAQHAYAAGDTLTADSVATRSLPRSAVPAEALTSVDDARGKVATVAATSGTVLTPAHVLGPRVTNGSGRVLAPIRLADADIAGYLAPGDRIDVVSATEAAAVVVAHEAVVVAIPAPKSTGFGGDSRGVLVVVAVAPTEATALAQAAAGARLSVSLH